MSDEKPIRIGITGIGSCMPRIKVTNADLERVLGGRTSDEWIGKHTGIKERGISSPDESLPVLMAVAGKRALDDAGITAGDVDYIYGVTNATDPILVPHLAAREQHLLDAPVGIACLDIHAGCCGTIYAVDQIASKIRDRMREYGGSIKVLLTVGDALFNVTDVEQRDNSIVLADGAGAMVFEMIPEEDKGIRRVIARADGSRGGVIHYESGFRPPLVGTDPVQLENRATLPGYFAMHGRGVNRFILEDNKVEMVAEVLQRSGFELSDLERSIIVPHQANCRTLGSWARKFRKMYGFEPKLVFTDGAEMHGNTSAASVVIATDELYRAGRLEPGDIHIPVAFGGGLTWGTFLNIWHKPRLATPRFYDSNEQEELVGFFNGRYQSLLGTFFKGKT